jgi:hypothetical protein
MLGTRLQLLASAYLVMSPMDYPRFVSLLLLHALRKLFMKVVVELPLFLLDKP